MPNEFIIKNGYFSQGNSQITGSLLISGSVTATNLTGSNTGDETNSTIITKIGFTPEDVSNKTTSTSLGTSDTLYPSQNAVKTYVDTAVNSAVLSPASKLFNYYNFI
jgi:hypothetical protein